MDEKWKKCSDKFEAWCAIKLKAKKHEKNHKNFRLEISISQISKKKFNYRYD